MIFIRDFKVMNVPGDCYEAALFEEHRFDVPPWGGPTSAEYVINSEIINGVTFHNPEGEVVVIGMQKADQKLLGLPFEAFGNMEHEIDRLHTTLIETKRELVKTRTQRNVFYNMRFWDRIKFAFSPQKEAPHDESILQ